MADERAPVSYKHSDHVEAVGLAGSAMAVDPRLRGLREFALLAMIHGFDGIAEVVARARLHLDERDEIVVLRDEIDIAAAAAEAAREDSPARALEPAGGDALAEFAELVGGLGHAAKLGAGSAGSITRSTASLGKKLRVETLTTNRVLVFR